MAAVRGRDSAFDAHPGPRWRAVQRHSTRRGISGRVQSARDVQPEALIGQRRNIAKLRGL